MTLPGGIFLSPFLLNSACVSHASRDSLLSVFHQFVRVDVAPPGGWQGETGNRFREGGIKKPPVESSGLWPCVTLYVTVCLREHRTVTPSLTACRGANRRAVSACHNPPGRNLCMLLPSHLFTEKWGNLSECANCSTICVYVCVHINTDTNIDRRLLSCWKLENY